jgi:hypothetical protein
MFDNAQWPFSDVVWITTSATAQEVLESFDDATRPDECVTVWPEGVASDRCPVPPGMRPVACWWD